jgi:hypothetical protein
MTATTASSDRSNIRSADKILKMPFLRVRKTITFFEVLQPFPREGSSGDVNLALTLKLSAVQSTARLADRCCEVSSIHLEPFIICLIRSKSMTPALGAPNASAPVLLTFWKWFPGMVARRVKLPRRHEQKTALAASGAKLLAPLIS